MTYSRLRALALGTVMLCAGCAQTVNGDPRSIAAADGAAPAVAPADLGTLLLSDAEMSDAIAVPGLVSHDPYQELTPPQGESYSDPSCAGALFNTMYTAYDGIDYTGMVGRKVGAPGDEWGLTDTDQGVVSFRSADEASRYVVRTQLDWDRCSDKRVSVSENKDDKLPQTYTVGFPTVTDEIPTLLISPEAGDGYLCERAIASRSNVVIDVYVCADDVKAEQAVAVVNSIANKMPH
ncbi:sensor domain-containing protein [Mycolicibacterium stellerae]|uniref:sensor domain-containing protein n=1 Tax=Mycolicibacterium stellerae TaxID=2358193 RepID=UPI000F0B3423|nr:sensor domain-containing protein [Mycolicibacterium stellerae]